jgi:hypothetical protein
MHVHMRNIILIVSVVQPSKVESEKKTNNTQRERLNDISKGKHEELRNS